MTKSALYKRVAVVMFVTCVIETACSKIQRQIQRITNHGTGSSNPWTDVESNLVEKCLWRNLPDLDIPTARHRWNRQLLHIFRLAGVIGQSLLLKHSSRTLDKTVRRKNP